MLSCASVVSDRPISTSSSIRVSVSPCSRTRVAICANSWPICEGAPVSRADGIKQGNTFES